MNTVDRHNKEIQRNLDFWNNKPILRKVYQRFYDLIADSTIRGDGLTVELGSGIGNLKQSVPNCICTDLFANPWIDQVENAYDLSFENNSVDNLIMFDVFHHLRYPGDALTEASRVLRKNGRLIIFEPCASLLGRVVYGCFHEEPLGMKDKIEWNSPPEWSVGNVDYYAAQGNACRIFVNGEFNEKLADWTQLKRRRLSAISYVTTGGYSSRQRYPDFAYPLMEMIDRVCDLFPLIFATRLLVVLELSN